jgi:Asp-tRNA(Asn)/Glu-tRNA(Gln) amidotransferase A subunit family amidase
MTPKHSGCGATPTLAQITAALSEGATTASTLVDQALAAACDSAGEGAVTFTRLRADAARREAAASDEARRNGRASGPLSGIPISSKDLFDLAGEVTTAGSRVLADRPAATRNADAIARLVDAGAIVIGRTTMTEFAYSGLGLNPHYGTPASPWRRAERRIPGGSSSGAAVSVSDAMCAAAIGTDTGGSVRIPAAFCGLTGFKPTARRIPTRGAIPLSTTLDSIGPIARSVACCALLDAIMAGDAPVPPRRRPPSQITLGVARNFFLDGADAVIATAFENALSRLAAAGFRLVDLDLPALERLPAINANGGFSAIEAWAWHRDLLAAREAQYDPRVAARIKRGATQTGEDAARLVRERQGVMREVAPALRSVDAIATVTVPIAPPTIASLTHDDAYTKANALVLRNPGTVNFIDGCALSLPCHRGADAPAGLMLLSGSMQDGSLLMVGTAVEQCLSAS